MISFIKENTIAISLLIIFLIFTIRGLRKGLIAMAAAVASIVFTLFAARRVEPIVLSFLDDKGILVQITDFINNLFNHNVETEHSKLYLLLKLDKVAIDFADSLAELILRILIFILLFIIIRIVIRLIVGILKQIKKVRIINFFDRLFGMVIGFAEGIFWGWSVLALLQLINIDIVNVMIEKEMLHAAALRYFIENNLVREFLMEIF